MDILSNSAQSNSTDMANDLLLDEPKAPQHIPAPSTASGEVPISMLLDLSLPVTIELGRTSMTVQDILGLGRGSVIQLDRLAGEPIDVFVGDRRFAEGEVVIIGETFGVRITRILPRTTVEEFGA